MTHDETLVVKAAIRERDGLCCTECGMSNVVHLAEFGSSLEVHRTTPGSEYSIEPGVCVTLCKSCHGPKPRRPRGTLPKPNGRAVKVDSVLVSALEQIADEQFNSLTEQVKVAVREYLERLDRLPKPKKS